MPGPSSREQVTGLWFVVVVAGLLVTLLGWNTRDVATWLPGVGACVITTAYAFGLGLRTGGRPLTSAGVALMLSGVAVITQMAVLLSGVVVGTTVLAVC